MNSSPNSTGRRAEPRPGPILVEDGGESARPKPRDPILAWMELMEVIEALCPRWPKRPPAIRGSRFRL